MGKVVVCILISVLVSQAEVGNMKISNFASCNLLSFCSSDKKFRLINELNFFF